MSGNTEPKVCFESTAGVEKHTIDERDWLLPENERAREAEASGELTIAVDWPKLKISGDWGSPRRRETSKS